MENAERRAPSIKKFQTFILNNSIVLEIFLSKSVF